MPRRGQSVICEKLPTAPTDCSLNRALITNRLSREAEQKLHYSEYPLPTQQLQKPNSDPDHSNLLYTKEKHTPPTIKFPSVNWVEKLERKEKKTQHTQTQGCRQEHSLLFCDEKIHPTMSNPFRNYPPLCSASSVNQCGHCSPSHQWHCPNGDSTHDAWGQRQVYFPHRQETQTDT